MFSIPDKGKVLADAQSIWFQEYIDILADGISMADCIRSGCAVTTAGTSLTLDVAAGVVTSNNIEYTIAGTVATLSAADASLARFDCVVINSAGLAAVRTGVASTIPVPPALVANDVVLAIVYVPATNTAVASNQIVDLRVINGAQPKNATLSLLALLTTTSDSRSYLQASGAYSLRNKIINGNFDIWQRGATQTITGYGSVDRWISTISGTTQSVSQQTFALGQTDIPGNPKYWYRNVVTSVAGVGNYALLIQAVEGVRTLAGKTATVSFWAKADAAKNIALELYQNFGSGGTPSAAVSGIGAQLIPLTTVWQKFTKTITIPSIVGATLGTAGDDSLQLNLWFDAGSNFNSRTATLGQQSGTFDIAQVQVEEGSVATPFEVRSTQLEFELCKNYYREIVSSVLWNYSSASGQFAMACYPGSMRTTPTVAIKVAGSPSSCTEAADVVGSGRNSTVRHVLTSTGTGGFGSGPTTISVSAEL